MARKATATTEKRERGRPAQSERGPRTIPVNFSASEIEVIDRVLALCQERTDARLNGVVEVRVSRADAIMAAIAKCG